MKKQILESEIKRIKQVMGILLETDNNEDSSSTDFNVESLKKELSKVGFKPGQNFELTDKDGNKQIMTIDNTGNVKELSEKNRQFDIGEEGKALPIIPIIAACAVLASGMVSCKKPNTEGFGYNFGVKVTTYYRDKGKPDTEINISTPQSDVNKVKVDKTIFKKTDFWSSQGSKFVRPITPTEAIIMKAGIALQRERNQNNGKGTPPNEVYNCDYRDANIEKNLYQNPDDNVRPSFNSCREHPLWKLGLRYFEIEGQNAQQMIQKADQELSQGIYY
jgi:hypothetical protein